MVENVKEFVARDARKGKGYKESDLHRLFQIAADSNRVAHDAPYRLDAVGRACEFVRNNNSITFPLDRFIAVVCAPVTDGTKEYFDVLTRGRALEEICWFYRGPAKEHLWEGGPGRKGVENALEQLTSFQEKRLYEEDIGCLLQRTIVRLTYAEQKMAEHEEFEQLQAPIPAGGRKAGKPQASEPSR